MSRVIVAGTIRVPPENIDALRPHALQVIEATRQEPGCIVYSFAEDLVEPGLIRIFEIWESREHLEAHGKAPHMVPWREAVQAHGVTERDLQVYPAGAGEPI